MVWAQVQPDPAALRGGGLMGRNSYAIEVEAGPAVNGTFFDSLTYGLTHGFLRYVTDRPGFDFVGTAAEKVVNGKFAADASWTKFGAATIHDGAAYLGDGYPHFEQAITLISGRTYVIRYTVVSGGCRFIVSDAPDGIGNFAYDSGYKGPGSYEYTFIANAATQYFYIMGPGSVFDSVSIRDQWTPPIGDNCVIALTLSGAQSLSVSMQSGQLYQASNGVFKSANTILAVRDRFTILSDADFTGGQLATAKGSAPAEGDMFEVTNNGAGTEAVKYIGINRWFKDFLMKEGMSNPSRSVDLEGSGDYGTLSGFNFTIRDTIIAGTNNPIWRYLAANGMSLANAVVRLYAVIDGAFYQIWTGVVENNPRSEVDFAFECKNNFKLIHKDIPSEAVTSEEFANAPDESLGKTMPVCVGDIEYAQMINVDGEPDWIKYNSYGNYGFRYECALRAYQDNAMLILDIRELRNGLNTFALNELTGKYLFILSGEKADLTLGNRILGNDRTGLYENFCTRLYLSERLLDTDGNPVDISKYGWQGSVNGFLQWRGAIGIIENQCLISQKAVSSFKKIGGRFQAWTYEADKKKYRDIAPFIANTSTSLASIYMRSKNLHTNGETLRLSTVPITLRNPVVYESQLGNDDSLVDHDRSTFITKSSTFLKEVTKTIDFDIDEDLGEDETLRVGVDLDVFDGSGSYPYARYTGAYTLKMVLMCGAAAVQTITLSFNNQSYLNLIPDDYYSDGNLNGERSIGGYYKSSLLLNALFYTLIKNENYRRSFSLDITVTISGAGSAAVNFKQIGFVSMRKYDLSADKMFTRVSGELTTGGAQSNTVYNAFRLMLETYNGISSADIEYGNLPTKRHNVNPDYWHVGRQLIENKNMADYIKELCQQSFVAAFQNRKGKIAFSAWLDRTDSPRIHDTTTIIGDSITEWELTSIDNVFNSFEVNYSKDPGAGKYFKTYKLKDVDLIEPPGWSDDWKPLWDVCRAAYLVYRAVKEFKINLDWFIDRSRWYNSGESGAVGIGTDGSAWHWLTNAVFWLTRQKRKAGYNVPLDATHVFTELCDPVNFKDPVFSNSLIDTAYLEGNVDAIEYDIQNDSIRIHSLLSPNDTIDDNYGDIIESGNSNHTITESGSAPDTITEDGQ
jgi:hypothetical protein